MDVAMWPMDRSFRVHFIILNHELTVIGKLVKDSSRPNKVSLCELFEILFIVYDYIGNKCHS